MTQHRLTDGKLATGTVAIWRNSEETNGESLEIHDVYLATNQSVLHVRNHGEIDHTKIKSTYVVKFKYLTSKSNPFWLPKSLHSITFEGEYGMESFSKVADQRLVKREQQSNDYDPDTCVVLYEFPFQERF